MGVSNYEGLAYHAGHKIVCVIYAGDHNAAVECETCNPVLMDFDNPKYANLRRIPTRPL